MPVVLLILIGIVLVFGIGVVVVSRRRAASGSPAVASTKAEVAAPPPKTAPRSNKSVASVPLESVVEGDEEISAEELERAFEESLADFEGEVVFAGYGLVVPESQGFGYDSYVGLDVKDKIVLVLHYFPEDAEPTAKAMLARYSDLRYKALNARQRGARGLLVAIGVYLRSPRSPAPTPAAPVTPAETAASAAMCRKAPRTFRSSSEPFMNIRAVAVLMAMPMAATIITATPMKRVRANP